MDKVFHGNHPWLRGGWEVGRGKVQRRVSARSRAWLEAQAEGPRSKPHGVTGAWQRQGHQRRAPTVNVAKWGPVFSTRQDMWPNEAQFSVAGKHMSAHHCEKHQRR